MDIANNYCSGDILTFGHFNLPVFGHNTDFSNGNNYCTELFYFININNLLLKNNILNQQGITLDLVLSTIDSVAVHNNPDSLVSVDAYHTVLEINVHCANVQSLLQRGIIAESSWRTGQE